jgi:hypothetical protein
MNIQNTTLGTVLHHRTFIVLKSGLKPVCN